VRCIRFNSHKDGVQGAHGGSKAAVAVIIEGAAAGADEIDDELEANENEQADQLQGFTSSGLGPAGDDAAAAAGDVQSHGKLVRDILKQQRKHEQKDGKPRG